MSAAGCHWSWIEHADSNVAGGTVTPSGEYDEPAACQSACLQHANCTGVDFNAAGASAVRCFLIFAANPTINDGLAVGVTHYERVMSCDGDVGTQLNLNYDSKYRARQLYKNISMLFLFPVKDGKLSTGVNATFNASCYG